MHSITLLQQYSTGKRDQGTYPFPGDSPPEEGDEDPD